MSVHKSIRTNNIIPFEGEAYYIENVLTPSQADYYFNILLLNVPWKHDEVIIFGKKYTTKRKVAWYGNQDYTYKYSNTVKTALAWTDEIFALKSYVESFCSTSFNSCLLNLYHDGNEGLGWHSDNEPELVKNGCIASLSLGAERIFKFKHKASKQVISISLKHGSLLLMQGSIQEYWKHQLPLTKKIITPRINLTFRNIISFEDK